MTPGMEPFVVLAGRVSGLDAVILALAFCMVRLVRMPGDKRAAAVLLALKIMGMLGAGAVGLRVLVILADQGLL